MRSPLVQDLGGFSFFIYPLSPRTMEGKPKFITPSSHAQLYLPDYFAEKLFRVNF